MNKAELIKELESRLGSRKAASEALTAVVDVIIREVAKGGSVAITGFGTFEQAARAARTGRNPRTGATVKIKKTVVPKFRAGSAFKDVVKNPRSLPKAAVAGARAQVGPRPAVPGPAGRGLRGPAGRGHTGLVGAAAAEGRRRARRGAADVRRGGDSGAGAAVAGVSGRVIGLGGAG